MHRTTSRLGRPRRALTLLTALTAAAAVLLPTTGAQATGRPFKHKPPAQTAPIAITVTDLISSVTTPATLGSPVDFVAKDTPLALAVSFSAELPYDVALSVTPSRSTFATPPGTTHVPAGATGATLTGIVLGEAANRVVLTVQGQELRKQGKALTPGSSAAFDVAKDFDPVDVQAPASGYTASREGLGVPCEATVEVPLCSDLVLPPSAGNGELAFFSTGVCDTSVGCRDEDVDVLQVLAQFELPKTDPGTLIVKCDKSLCGGGALKDNVLLAVLTEHVVDRVHAASRLIGGRPPRAVCARRVL